MSVGAQAAEVGPDHPADAHRTGTATDRPAGRPAGARLLGRRDDVTMLDALVAEVRGGGSRVLLVRGDAGIGKTALLDHVAAAAGVTTLRVTGVPSEQHLPLAGLLTVARPLAGHVDALPPVQASSLGAALGRTSEGAGDPYSLYAGTLGLLAAAAEEAPLLVLVDDLHWLDPSSGAALLFAARRLDHEGVGMIFAVRDGEDVELDLRGLPELHLAGLDDDAARELVTDRAGTVPADEPLARLIRTAAGNPLALTELTGELDDPQLAGRAPLPEPLVLGPRLGELYRQRLGALPDHTRRALLVAAVCDTGHLGTVVRACGHKGLDPDSLDPAETAGLITVGDVRISFRHPLVRAAVLGAATDSRRRDAHLVLAEVCADDPTRRAWHRSWAVPGPDEDVADALERASGLAAARGALTESAKLLERAGGLSPAGEAGARRLAAAGRQRLVTGSPGLVTALCDRALAATADPRLRSRVVRLRAQARQVGGDLRGGVGELLAEADRIGPVRSAAPLLTEASSALCTIGDLDAAVQTAQRAYLLTRDVDDAGARTAEIMLGTALMWSGRDPAAAGLLEPLIGRPVTVPPAVESYWSALLAFGLMQLGRHDSARALLRSVVDTVRARSAVALLPIPLTVLAYVEHRMGETLAAHACAVEAVQLARDLGGLTQEATALATLAWTEAARGRTAEARSAGAACIELERRIGSLTTLVSVHTALGFAELGAGEPARALGPLEEAQRLSVASGLAQHVVPWPADLIEAYLACGRRADALAVLGRLESAVPDRAGWVPAAAARGRGLLTSGPESDDHFATALRLHDAAPTVLDQARTLLCWGEGLRRTGRRIEARDKLREALQIFERISTPQWAERARRELAGTGERSRRRTPDTRAELTPQEMQIAQAVVDGATNREAAAALFLSPKTVENHLGRVYAKLGVRSRTELGALLRTAR